jgi:hypothetical protein
LSFSAIGRTPWARNTLALIDDDRTMTIILLARPKSHFDTIGAPQGVPPLL